MNFKISVLSDVVARGLQLRNDWPDEDWKGWWGDNPPYQAPTFVLTHYRRQSIVMEGSTVFHFATEGIEAALDQAREAAKGKDVKIGGGVSPVRQYLKAGLIDELHLALSPNRPGICQSRNHNILDIHDNKKSHRNRTFVHECWRHGPLWSSFDHFCTIAMPPEPSSG